MARTHRAVVDQRDHGALNRTFRRKDQVALAVAAALGLLAACEKAPETPAPIRLPPGLAQKAYPPRGWTWAEIPGSAGRRYGVASPSKAMRAQVVIVPGRAPAEAWFETANRLVERNYGVWIVDPLPGPVPPAALRAMLDEVVRPGDGRRVVIIGDGDGAQAALLAGSGADLALLWSPKLAAPAEGAAPWAVKLGLGKRTPLGAPKWTEGDPKGDAIATAWMAANPALRPLPWSFEQRLAARAQALAAQAARPALSVRIAGGDAEAQALCKALKDCKPIAPGVDAAAAAFDGLTADDAFSAPPQVKRARGI